MPDKLRRGPYPGKPEEMEDYEPPSRPTPYAIEEAFEEAFSPSFNLPTHTDELEEEYARIREKRQTIAKGLTDPPKAVDEQPATNQPTATDHATDHAQATEQPEQPATDLGNQETATGSRALVMEAPPPVSFLTPATAAADELDLPPETIVEALRPLKPWMREYITELMNLGGNETLACKRRNVSAQTIRKFSAISSEFATAIHDAKEWATNLVEASLFQSATVGDLKAVYRGPYLVGYERVKSVKAAEILLEQAGRLGDRGGNRGGMSITVNAKNAVVVPQVADSDLPSRVAATVAKLIQANRGRPIDVTPVSGPETATG